MKENDVEQILQFHNEIKPVSQPTSVTSGCNRQMKVGYSLYIVYNVARSARVYEFTTDKHPHI